MRNIFWKNEMTRLLKTVTRNLFLSLSIGLWFVEVLNEVDPGFETVV